MRPVGCAELEDLIHLAGPLTEDAVLKCLQARFCASQFFVSISCLLLAAYFSSTTVNFFCFLVPFSSFFDFIFSVLIFFFSILFLAPYCVPQFSCFSSHFTFLFLCLASSVSLLILFVTPLTLIHILLSFYHLLFPHLLLVPIHHLSHYPTSFLLFPFFLMSIHHFIFPLLLFISLYYNLLFPSLLLSFFNLFLLPIFFFYYSLCVCFFFSVPLRFYLSGVQPNVMSSFKVYFFSHVMIEGGLDLFSHSVCKFSPLISPFTFT